MARKVWFVTGVSRGLGRSLAKAVLAKGDIVIATTRTGEPPAGVVFEGLFVVPLDVTDCHQAARAVETAQARHGRIDVLVNSAGCGLLGPIEAATPEQAEHVFAVNFFGPLALIRAALPLLREQRSGHIVNISSIAGIAPTPGSGLYAAAKFALEGLSQSLAQEVAPFGIWVTLVEPGAFPLNLLLGSDALNRARMRLDRFEEDLTRWESLTVSTDFPA